MSSAQNNQLLTTKKNQISARTADIHPYLLLRLVTEDVPILRLTDLEHLLAPSPIPDDVVFELFHSLQHAFLVPRLSFRSPSLSRASIPLVE